jgi:hypothetical protein
MRGLKTLLCSTAMLASLALVPAVQAQVVISIQPTCSYGYYDYAPYACAPAGFYGPGYFYNGIFLGMGPWAGWGYSHGWGHHRFSNGGGGRYTGGGGMAANHVHATRTSTVRASSGGRSYAHAPAASHRAATAHGDTPHEASHAAPVHGASHEAAAHGGGSHGDAHPKR